MTSSFVFFSGRIDSSFRLAQTSCGGVIDGLQIRLSVDLQEVVPRPPRSHLGDLAADGAGSTTGHGRIHSEDGAGEAGQTARRGQRQQVVLRKVLDVHHSGGSGLSHGVKSGGSGWWRGQMS